MQQLIVSNIIKKFQGNPIKLLSLGSGGCLQDLILIAKLVAAGFYSIHITLKKCAYYLQLSILKRILGFFSTLNFNFCNVTFPW